FVEPEPPPESPREDALPADDETPREESAPTELAEAPAPGPTSAPRRGHPSAPSAPTAADLTAIGDAIQHAVDLRIGALVAEGGALDDLMREGAMPASQADVMG